MSYFRFLISRVIILAVVVAVSWLMLNSVIRRTIINLWHENTGTRLAIGEVKIHLEPTRLDLSDLTITTDEEHAAKLATVERVSVRFDRNELLRRWFYADETHLSNIRFELAGQGENGLDLTEYWNDAQTQFDLIASQVRQIPLDQLMSNNLDEAAKQLARQFETYDYGDKLKQRWSKEIETFKTDANKVKGRIDAIKQHLANAERTQDILAAATGVLLEIDALALEMKTLENAVPELTAKLSAEKNALTAVVEKDQKKLELLTRPTIESNDFSEYVLGGEMRERLTGLIAWIDWCRTLVPEEDTTCLDQATLFSSKRRPGTNVALPGIETRPEVHFGGIGLDGQATLWGQPLFFVGGIRDYSNQPKKMGKPMVLRFCIAKELPDKLTQDDYLRILADHEAKNLFLLDPIRAGQQPQVAAASQILPPNTNAIDFFRLPETMIVGDDNRNLTLDMPTLYVTAMLDRTGEAPHDRFLISCPDYHLPQRVLGNPQQIAFSVSPGVSQFRAELDIQGDTLTGKLVLHQSPITIQARLPQNMRGTPLESGLAAATQALNTIHAEIEISGLRTAPTYAFYTNLGDRITDQVESIFQQEWGQINSKLTSLLNQQITTSSDLLDAVSLKEIQPLLDNLKMEQGQITVALQQGKLDIDQLLRSQLYRFPEDQQEKINDILGSPLGQSLLNRNPQTGTTDSTNNIGSQLEQRANELINRNVTPEAQNALRGFLGGIGGNSQPQSPSQNQPAQ